MTIGVQTTKGFPETSTTLRDHLEASVTSSFLGAALYPEDISDLEPHSATLKPLSL